MQGGDAGSFAFHRPFGFLKEGLHHPKNVMLWCEKNDKHVIRFLLSIAKDVRNVILPLVECGITDNEKTIIE